jgi:hypothetical protein
MFHHHMARGGETARRASVFEIVGAWLHVWVPPRDVEIPPVPWRKLAIGTAAGLVVLGVALAILVPRIDQGKARRTAAENAATARSREAEHRRIVAEQRPHHGAGLGLRPPAGASPAQQQAARQQLVRQISAAVLADARARFAHHTIPFPVSGPATCGAHQGTTLSGRFGVLDCFVVASKIKKTARTTAGEAGYPFRAIVDFRKFTYAWCKVEGIPGEMSIPDPRLVVALPRACQAPNN